MNELDKLIAQQNGMEAGLPPFHKYIIVFEPKANKYLKIIKESNKTFVEFKNKEVNTSFATNYEAEPSRRIEIDMSQLITNYAIYYDDPTETEEERLNLVDKVQVDAQNHKSGINRRIKIFDEKAELTFTKRIKKLDYHYKPLIQQFIEAENKQRKIEESEKDGQVEKELILELPEPIDKPTERFMERISHLIRSRD